MSLLQKIFPFLAAKKPEPTDDERRAAGDAAKLAEYRAFDAEVGAAPTQEALAKRFRDAVFAGHTNVVKDTLEKGGVVPHEINSTWCPPGGTPIMMKHKPLELAAQREWRDMVAVIAPACDRDNLEAALRAAEYKNDAPVAKAVRAEMTRRDTPETIPAPATPDGTALTEAISVRKSALQLK